LNYMPLRPRHPATKTQKGKGQLDISSILSLRNHS
jgi:hypothetical protein